MRRDDALRDEKRDEIYHYFLCYPNHTHQRSEADRPMSELQHAISGRGVNLQLEKSFNLKVASNN
jgi:hypothetical protein